MKKCIYCEHLEQLGRQQTQQNRLGRKKYYCRHPEVKGYSFVCFGDRSYSSSATIKTAKRFCPYKNVDEIRRGGKDNGTSKKI